MNENENQEYIELLIPVLVLCIIVGILGGGYD
jgi:hypothetical protein